jgi:dienelactone hydrolase
LLYETENGFNLKCWRKPYTSANMRIVSSWALLAVIPLVCCTLAAQSRQEVQTKEFRGRVYAPAKPSHDLAVVLIGGSEGGLQLADEIAPQLVSAGYVVLGVDYHDGWRPGRKLDLVPIETFTAAVKWLYASPFKPGKVAVIGDSRGSEGALLTGIHDPDVSAVLAFVPSSVVWGATDNDATRHHSAWSWGGQELLCANCVGDGDFGSILDKLAADAPSRLSVESIRGPVFLVGSSADAVWPSARMAHDIANRLLSRHFAYPVVLLTYPQSSHLLFGTGPSSPTSSYEYGGRVYTMNYGGTSLGTEQARNQSWAAMLLFLQQVEAGKS